MAILVTGAAGFVGLNVVEHLLRAGRSVVGLDRIDLPARARRLFATLPGRLVLIGGSVLSGADLARALTIAKVDAVIHCAVITAGAAREQADPEGIVAVNVQGAVAALTAAARRGVKRFVYTSSQSVYGAALDAVEVADEAMTPRLPLLLYGRTKLACEDLLPRIAASQRVGFVAARLASVYGPWEYATGVRDTLSPMLGGVEAARRGEEAVLNAPGRVDFVYAPDVAAALVRLADRQSPDHGFYNVGSGRARSAAEWCAALAACRPGFRWRLAGAGEEANVVSWSAGDRAALAIGRIGEEFGWRPRQFEETASDYLAWAGE